jgi:3-isopropylmalate/(R)-2-methylmalate dehydratase small subunit
MEKFTTLEAAACPLGLTNVDTDQLIPARFMMRSRADGYGRFLLHDQRYDTAGLPHGGHLLDQPRYAGAKIIVARRGFGTGSSREAAVYALWDFGIRCVIAPSFGDIFASNAAKNGLLAAVVCTPDLEALLTAVTDAATPVVAVDLDAQSIRVGQLQLNFTVDPVRRLQLLNGWDDIDLTLRHRAEIDAFKLRLTQRQPWATAATGP